MKEPQQTCCGVGGPKIKSSKRTPTFAKKINMIIYNVTVSVDEDVAEKWLKWMREIHIPEVMATGYFVSSRLCRVIGGTENGITYATQYECESLAKMQQYETKAAPALRADHQKHFEGKTVAFRTLLETL